MTKPDLSVIILSYNTKNVLNNCLTSLNKIRSEAKFEVIVVDNGSADGSPEMVTKRFNWVKLLETGKNLGFSAGNNYARKVAKGKYILFLNSDTVVYPRSIAKPLEYMEGNVDVGALTVKLVLPDGKLDKDTRRAFITPWNAFAHLYMRADLVFPKSKLFGQYWYGYIDEDTVHEVDVIQGAYFLTRKSVLDKVGWFDEDYFLDGEDIDLCWRIKKVEGKKIIYWPKVKVLHIKGASKGKSKAKKNVPFQQRLKYKMTGVNSMELFYRKHLWKKYPLAWNYFMLTGIKLMKLLRYIQVRLNLL